MTVGELIAMLEALPKHLLVVLSSDSEGNSYSPVDGSGYGKGIYTPESTWSGEFRSDPVDFPDSGYDEEDVEDFAAAKEDPDTVEAIALYPTA